MQTTLKSSPKDVFLHLFNIVTFYLSIIGFITLYINYIDALFPDALNYYFTSIANGVRWASSVLAISVPAYIFSAWLLGKDLRKTPEKRELRLRKWLTYFTLFISAITIIIDLMIFVYNFLDGELTIKFFLKVVVVLLVAAAVFGYYMWDLRQKNNDSKVPHNLAIVVAALVLASIILGFFIVGTPKQQRNRRIDDQKVMELQTLQSQIVDYWSRKKVLPEELEALQDNISGFKPPADPESGKPYEYNVIEPLKFKLCADFLTSNTGLPSSKSRSAYTSPYSPFQQNWEHEKGRTCFSRTIDPDLYDKGDIKPIPIN